MARIGGRARWVEAGRGVPALTCPGLTFGPVSRKLDCVRLPPLLCMEIAAISAPASIAVMGMPAPK